jgi:Uma2 family endonuclease
MATAIDVQPTTAAEFQELEFDLPVELVRGEIIEMTRPGARHGRLCVKISSLLENWSTRSGGYCILSNDPGVLTERNPDSVRGPDVLAIQTSRLPGGKLPTGWLTVAPDLIVEVLSPTDQWPAVLEKVTEFLRAGVQEAWVVDPEQQTVHVFRADVSPRIVHRGETLASEPLLPGFAVAAEQLFEGL